MVEGQAPVSRASHYGVVVLKCKAVRSTPTDPPSGISMKGWVLGNQMFRRSQSYPAMRPFAAIFARAVTRKGGKAALERILPTPASRPAAEIASPPDDRLLAEMTRRIFYAGFSSK